MTSARLALAAVLAALFSVVAAGVAHAQVYPDPIVKVSGARLIGGLDVDFEAQASVDCTWEVTFLDQTATGQGSQLSGTFSTPVVDKITPHPINASCTYTRASTPSASSSSTTGGAVTVTYAGFVTADPVARASNTITLLPQGGNVPAVDSNGILPGAGGSSLWILIVGGALVLVGGGAAVATRRRS